MMRHETIRLTRAQVRQIDRLAIEEYHIPGIVLMENAARGVADEVQRILPGKTRPIAIFCGAGNNGGDGFALARHLHNRGFEVEVVLLTDPDQIKADAAINLQIIQKMGLYITLGAVRRRLTRQALLVDAIFGTGLNRAPSEPFASAIEQINAFALPVLAVDVPSGLDCDSGEPLGACIRAVKTVTFVAEKAGFANPQSQSYTGEVVVADIGAPWELVQRV